MGERWGDEVPSLDAFFAAVRPHELDAEAQERAVAAFRAAREQGAYTARTRRRDDWRPRARRFAGRSLRTTFAALFACVTLGGVAVASIGTFPGDGPEGGPDRPSSTAPTAPGDTGTVLSPSPSQQQKHAGKTDKPDKKDGKAGKGKADKSTLEPKKPKQSTKPKKPKQSTKPKK